jgi:hypothetical protein
LPISLAVASLHQKADQRRRPLVGDTAAGVDQPAHRLVRAGIGFGVRVIAGGNRCDVTGNVRQAEFPGQHRDRHAQCDPREGLVRHRPGEGEGLVPQGLHRPQLGDGQGSPPRVVLAGTEPGDVRPQPPDPARLDVSRHRRDAGFDQRILHTETLSAERIGPGRTVAMPECVAFVIGKGADTPAPVVMVSG